MYDHIKVGDLVYIKRQINVCKDKNSNICLVLYKEKLEDDFLFSLLCKNQVVTYDTTLFNRNITIEPLDNYFFSMNW
jgi:hypothetical protein